MGEWGGGLNEKEFCINRDFPIVVNTPRIGLLSQCRHCESKPIRGVFTSAIHALLCLGMRL